MAKKQEVNGQSPKPNIKLREGATPATIEGEVNAPGASKIILLPSLKDQKAGWYAPNAAEIIRLYGDRYIPYVEKGGEV